MLYFLHSNLILNLYVLFLVSFVYNFVVTDLCLQHDCIMYVKNSFLNNTVSITDAHS